MLKDLKGYRLNVELSREVYEERKEDIIQGGCYNNIYKVYSRDVNRFREQGWKFAYGYINLFGNDNLMIRHCFILTAKNEVIDPTLVAPTYFDESHYTAPEVYSHFTFAEFTIDEYVEKLAQNDFNPDLIPLYRKKEMEYQNWGMTQNPCIAFMIDTRDA